MNGFQISLLTLFFPADGFLNIKKDRERFSYLAPTVILLIALVSNIAAPFIIHYPISTVDIYNINLFQQVFSFLIPFFLWVIGSYYVTCIFSGETKMREVYAATCYALLPYALFTIPLTLFTNVLDISGASLYNTGMTIIWLWAAVLVMTGIKVMNSYTFFQMIKVILCSFIAVLFVAVIAVLLYVLGVKLFDFITELVNEYRILIFG